MENNQDSDQSVDQDKPSATATGGEETTDIEQSSDAQSDGQTDSKSEDILHKKELPPELEATRKELLKSFHQKTQALSAKEKEFERYASDAKMFYELGQEKWFKDAVAAEKARRAGATQEISDEEFETIRSNKKAFQDFLSRQNKAVAESLKSEFKGEFEKLSKNQKEILAEKEFDDVAGVYGQDFIEANDTNALDSYLDKGYSYEDSFKLYMQDQGKVAKKADSRPAPSRSAVIEKRGAPSARGSAVVKAKNLDDALNRAFDLARKGQKDYRLEKA